MLAMSKVVTFLCCAVLLPALAGCVERRLFIRSDPIGASVVVNGDPAGMTPAKVDFVTYGAFDVVLSAPGHRRRHVVVEVEAPWWETIPIDFVVENLWPFIIVDEHEENLVLEPFDASDEPDIDKREEHIRNRLEGGE
jgi:PEGA domain